MGAEGMILPMPSGRAKHVRPADQRAARRRRDTSGEADPAVVRSAAVTRSCGVRFRLLGPLEAEAERGPISLGTPQQRAVLALLLLNANEVVSLDRLIAELWPGEPPDTATKLVQVYVSRLRKAFEAATSPNRDEVVVTQSPGYLLRVGHDDVDVCLFERLLDQGREALSAGNARDAAERYRAALALWRGPPLADLVFKPFAQGEIRRLEELRLMALEDRIDAELALGRTDLVGELEPLVASHPLRERLRGQLMLALYRSGRQAEALEAYRYTHRTLIEELGIEPGKALRELHQRILLQDPALDLARSPAADEGDGHGAFVGRTAELAELVTGLQEALRGRGRLFLIAGEPGIGKSRLTEELIACARGRGARILVGRCWEAGGAPAYWPWVQSLRAYVRDTDAEQLRSQLAAGGPVLAQILPELRERLPDLPQAPPLESEVARFRLFDATAEFLRKASERRPIVLVLDDLHAADAPSLLLLQFLARELGHSRLLIVGAYRDVDPIAGGPLTRMLAAVAREPATRRLSLARLGERDVAEYVELTAPEIASRELVTALEAKTEGNPLFLGEMVRLLSAEGYRADAGAEVRLTISESVRDVIARRLSHLSEECERVLVLGAVLGREFGVDALARAAGVPKDELLDTLDEAMAGRVISAVPGAPRRLRFAHVLIRDTLYEGLTTVRRVRLHRLVVEALEDLYGDEPGAHLAELAHHSIAGSDFEKGFRYAQRAADRALALLAYEESARLYEMALEALELADRPDDRARCELLLSLGEAQARAGDSPAAKRVFVGAADIARRLGLPSELARAGAGYGGRTVWARAGDDDRLVPLLQEGLAALGEEDVELRARLLARLAGALRDEPSRARRDRLSSEAVALARRTGNPAALAYALDGRAAAIVAPDTVDEGLALGSELRDVAERSGDPEQVVAGHLWRIIAQLQVGDVRGAQVDLAQAHRIAEGLRQPAPLWELRATQAMLALASGRLAAGEELTGQAFALGERAQPESAIPVHRLQRYMLCDLRSTLDDALPGLRELVAEYPARPAFHCALAHAYARLGHGAEARRALDELARDDFAAVPFDQEWLYGMSLLAETAALLGDAGHAAILYRLLAPWEAFNVADVAEGMRGSVARYLGLLAATTGRWDGAERHFEHALEMNASMGAHAWLAHTHGDLAGVLLERGGPGDARRALEHAGDAREASRSMGMARLAAEAAALQRRAGGRRRRPA